ncbi:hypothetical protein Tco_0323877 [Tanacetum coccineum]
MGYHFYNPHENKVSVARHTEIFKNKLKYTRSEWESHFAKSEWEYCSSISTGTMAGVDVDTHHYGNNYLGIITRKPAPAWLNPNQSNV